MGLFGLFHAAFIGSIYVAGGVRDVIDDNKSRNEAIKEGRDWYLDRRGNEKLTCNGKSCRSDRLANGDRVLTDFNGNVYRNYSEEKRNASRAKAIAEGKTVYWDLDEKSDYQWVDIKTGEKYRKHHSFYEDNKGYWVRITDEALKAAERPNIRSIYTYEALTNRLYEHNEWRTRFLKERGEL